jgi:hypothetical protein
MKKSITVSGYNIPEKFTNEAEYRVVKKGDCYFSINAEEFLMTSLDDRLYSECSLCLIPKQKKKIDYQKLIDNKVLCEFGCYENFRPKPLPSYLAKIGNGGFFCDNGFHYAHCRPAYNILLGHDGGDCPLPAGVRVEVFFRDPDRPTEVSNCSKFHWEYFGKEFGCERLREIVSYKIIGISEGYEL